MRRVSIAFSYLLLLAATVMFVWGVLGFVEYLTGNAVFVSLQNPSFPSGTQFLHWLLLTATGGTYLVGYFLRWKHFPVAMMVLFAMLGMLCAVQTFDFLQEDESWSEWNFVREVFYYVIIVTYLFRSELMRERFGR